MNQSSGSVKSDRAYSFLRHKLVTGAYVPGERLVESQIAEELNLSRVPVREALQRLENEGLVVSPRAGLSRIVRCIEDMSPEDVLSHFEAREAIEGMAARLAAKNMTGWQIDGMREIASEYERATSEGGDQERVRLAIRFHRYLLANCGNARLLAIWESQDLSLLSTRDCAFAQMILSGMPDDRSVPLEFAPVVEAIAAHDPDRSERVMREFIGSMRLAVQRVLMGRIDKEAE